MHFSTFICIEQVLNIVIFANYLGYTVYLSPIIKCGVGEIDTMILKFLHGVKKDPNQYQNFYSFTMPAYCVVISCSSPYSMQIHFPEVIQINETSGSDTYTYIGLYRSDDTGS